MHRGAQFQRLGNTRRKDRLYSKCVVRWKKVFKMQCGRSFVFVFFFRQKVEKLRNNLLLTDPLNFSNKHLWYENAKISFFLPLQETQLKLTVKCIQVGVVDFSVFSAHVIEDGSQAFRRVLSGNATQSTNARRIHFSCIGASVRSLGKSSTSVRATSTKQVQHYSRATDPRFVEFSLVRLAKPKIIPDWIHLLPCRCCLVLVNCKAKKKLNFPLELRNFSGKHKHVRMSRSRFFP